MCDLLAVVAPCSCNPSDRTQTPKPLPKEYQAFNNTRSPCSDPAEKHRRPHSSPHGPPLFFLDRPHATRWETHSVGGRGAPLPSWSAGASGVAESPVPILLTECSSRAQASPSCRVCGGCWSEDARLSGRHPSPLPTGCAFSEGALQEGREASTSQSLGTEARRREGLALLTATPPGVSSKPLPQVNKN